MKQINKIGIVLLMIFLISIMSGCNNHSKKNPESTIPSTTISTETTSPSTEDPNELPADVSEILANNLRKHFEREKAFREDDSIAVTINGIPIYQSEIEIKASVNSTGRENFRIQLDSMQIPEQEKTKGWEEYIAVTPTDKEVILNELIRETAIQFMVVERSLFPNDEEVLALAQEKFTLIKDVPGIYADVQMYMEIMNLSEDDYVSQLADEQRKEMGKEALYSEVTREFGTETEQDKAFETAVDAWIAKADIAVIAK